MIDPNTYGWSDIARRRAFERRHQGAHIEPMYGPRTTPLWVWGAMGAVLAAFLVWML